jgi:hypothetical protein
MADLLYSFGILHPGAITLHNYPHFLRQLVQDNGDVFDLAAVDILRDRERGVPRYNRFREIIGRGRVKTFEEITSNPQWAKELREVYNNDIGQGTGEQTKSTASDFRLKLTAKEIVSALEVGDWQTAQQIADTSSKNLSSEDLKKLRQLTIDEASKTTLASP